MERSVIDITRPIILLTLTYKEKQNKSLHEIMNTLMGRKSQHSNIIGHSFIDKSKN